MISRLILTFRRLPGAQRVGRTGQEQIDALGRQQHRALEPGRLGRVVQALAQGRQILQRDEAVAADVEDRAAQRRPSMKGRATASEPAGSSTCGTWPMPGSSTSTDTGTSTRCASSGYPLFCSHGISGNSQQRGQNKCTLLHLIFLFVDTAKT